MDTNEPARHSPALHSTEATPNNVLLPQGGEPVAQAPVTVEQVYAAILLAKHARKPARKQLRVPKQPPAHWYLDKHGKRKSGWVGRRVLAHLNVIALRTLQDLHDAGRSAPGEDVLRDALEEYSFTFLRGVLLLRAPGEAPPNKGERWLSLDDEALNTVCGLAASGVLDFWDPSFMEIRRERGRRGGLRSRRGRKWGTVEHLAALRGPLANLTVREQAQALGCSASTVDRLRAVIRDEVDGHRVA